MTSLSSLPHCFFYPHLRTCLLILERGEGREREGERNINQLSLALTLTGDQIWNLGMHPDQESNLWPFGLWDDALTNWATLARATVFKQNKTTKSKQAKIPPKPPQTKTASDFQEFFWLYSHTFPYQNLPTFQVRIFFFNFEVSCFIIRLRPGSELCETAVPRTELLLIPANHLAPHCCLRASPLEWLVKARSFLCLTASVYAIFLLFLLMSSTDFLIMSPHSLKSLTTLRQHSPLSTWLHLLLELEVSVHL